MTRLALVSLLLLAACESTPEPIVDLKASKTPENFLTDWQQCTWIVEKYDLEAKTALIKCLDGRGYVALGLRGE